MTQCIKTTRIKICGITRGEDAQAALAAGAHALGFVFVAASPRYVEVERAAAIVRTLPPFAASVALFVDAEAAHVKAMLKEIPFDMLQFHGDESPDYCASFGLPYLKAVRVSPQTDLLEWSTRFSGARGLLLDAWVEGSSGGTGKTFDWSLIPEALREHIVLSGGLDPSNVHDAVRTVRPAAVDVSSGVEASKGIKDAEKIRAFISEVKRADV